MIVSVNKHPVRNVAEFRSIIAGLKPGDDVVFELVDPQHPKGGSSYVGGTLAIGGINGNTGSSKSNGSR